MLKNDRFVLLSGNMTMIRTLLKEYVKILLEYRFREKESRKLKFPPSTIPINTLGLNAPFKDLHKVIKIF